MMMDPRLGDTPNGRDSQDWRVRKHGYSKYEIQDSVLVPSGGPREHKELRPRKPTGTFPTVAQSIRERESAELTTSIAARGRDSCPDRLSPATGLRSRRAPLRRRRAILL